MISALLGLAFRDTHRARREISQERLVADAQHHDARIRLDAQLVQQGFGIADLARLFFRLRSQFENRDRIRRRYVKFTAFGIGGQNFLERNSQAEFAAKDRIVRSGSGFPCETRRL
jgi:hypothetical protein